MSRSFILSLQSAQRALLPSGVEMHQNPSPQSEIMKSEVTIVDAGLGNALSVLRMFEAAEVDAEVTRDPSALKDSRRIVLPGVGAYDAGVTALTPWRSALDDAVLRRKAPLLGICLGMQLLCRGSEEGKLPGLGWIAADVHKLDTSEYPRLKIPHMGWAEVRAKRANPLIAQESSEQRYYHVHTYRAVCDDPRDVIATAHYGREFTTAFGHSNIFGVQFHPEKSHRFGKELLRRFVRLPC